MGIYLQWQTEGKPLQCVVTNMENEVQNNKTYFSFSFLSFVRHPADAIFIRRVSDAETKPK